MVVVTGRTLLLWSQQHMWLPLMVESVTSGLEPTECERCWDWLYGVVCLLVCMLLDQWCHLSLRSMSWSNQGEETKDCGVIRSQHGMQIFVKGMTGRTITLTVAWDVSVETIKKTILRIEGVPISHQRLLYGGKQLEDDKGLDNYYIFEGSTLHLMPRLLGGGPEPGYGCADPSEKSLGCLLYTSDAADE